MTGRAEVERLKQILDATFERAKIASADSELLSDFARYLCVLVSGFLEQSIIEILLAFVRTRSQLAVQRFVERKLRSVANLNAPRLIELLGSFDPGWRADLESYVIDERKAAVDSVVALRNRIAHGQADSVTMRRVQEYYTRVKDVVDHIADLCIS
jgi:hypothetical protein